MSPRKPILVLTLAILFTAAPAHATMMRAVPFEEKVENAAAILVGRVVAQRSEWDAAREWILTYSTVRVEKVLKGMPAQEVTIVTPGGTVGTIAQEVVGVPKFQEGDEQVVFLRQSQAGPTVLFLEQGAYDVVADARGERVVKPRVAATAVMDHQRGAAVEGERVRSLREFEGDVRETMRRREAIRMELLEQQRKKEASLWNQLSRNWALVLLALIGSILAGWQFLRRS